LKLSYDSLIVVLGQDRGPRWITVGD
jgi:hypothetical protein